MSDWEHFKDRIMKVDSLHIIFCEIKHWQTNAGMVVVFDETFKVEEPVHIHVPLHDPRECVIESEISRIAYLVNLGAKFRTNRIKEALGFAGSTAGPGDFAPVKDSCVRYELIKRVENGNFVYDKIPWVTRKTA